MVPKKGTRTPPKGKHPAPQGRNPWEVPRVPCLRAPAYSPITGTGVPEHILRVGEEASYNLWMGPKYSPLPPLGI
jgi:hypothetical protein